MIWRLNPEAALLKRGGETAQDTRHSVQTAWGCEQHTKFIQQAGGELLDWSVRGETTGKLYFWQVCILSGCTTGVTRKKEACCYVRLEGRGSDSYRRSLCNLFDNHLKYPLKSEFNCWRALVPRGCLESMVKRMHVLRKHFTDSRAN